MKLGAYTFEWTPDRWTIPDLVRDVSYVETFSAVAFYSWGSKIVGRPIYLEWDWMKANQYLRIKDLEDNDTQVEWDTEVDDRIYYTSGVNTPFTTGKTITGSITAETAVISAVDTIEKALNVDSASGFQVGETITDDSIPAKTGVITSIERIPVYNVEILPAEGQYFEVVGPKAKFRRNLKLGLLIMSEA